MPPLAISEFGQEFYDALGAWARADLEDYPAGDGPLRIWCEAIGGRFQDVEDIIRDRPTGPGWSSVMDVDNAPVGWLGWLAQFIGVRLLPGLAEAEQRARIKSTDGFKRGTPRAMVAAAQQYLTGAKTVYLIERHGSAYRATLATKVSETPTPSLIPPAVQAQKPGGIVLAIQLVTGADYDSYRDTHASYNTAMPNWATYTAMLADPTAGALVA